jgi:hypothetical protein
MYNLVTLHEDVSEKVTSLEAMGHYTTDIDFIVSLSQFIALGFSGLHKPVPGLDVTAIIDIL